MNTKFIRPIAQTGSDFGGSLRTPAAFCGVVGFRASPGLVPRDDTFSPSGPRHNVHSVNGPMARCVRDVGLLLDAMSIPTSLLKKSGWDFPPPPRLSVPTVLTGHGTTASSWTDSWEDAAICGTRQGIKAVSSIMSCNAPPATQFASSPLSMGFSTLGCTCDLRVVRLAREATDTFVRALNAFEESLPRRSVVRTIDEPFDHRTAWRVFCTLRASTFANGFRALMADAKSRLTLKPEIVWNATQGLGTDYRHTRDRAMRDSANLLRQVEMLFSSTDRPQNDDSESTTIDLLFTPATICAAFDSTVRYPSALGDTTFSSYLDWMRMACVVSVTQCPSIVLPCGRLPCGRPVGVQIVGAPGADATVLAAAAFLETVLRWEKPSVRRLYASCPTPTQGFAPLVPDIRGPQTAEAAAKHHMVAAPP